MLMLMGKPPVGWLGFFLFLGTLGFILADVCTDAVLVERRYCPPLALQRLVVIC
jgi:hypothetical protein